MLGQRGIRYFALGSTRPREYVRDTLDGVIARLIDRAP